MTRLPVARTEGLLVEPVGDETVIYDSETKEAHCLKPLAAIVFAHADGTMTTHDAAALAEQRLGESVTEDDVANAVDELRASSLIDTPMLFVEDGLSRRQMLRRTAYAGAAATTAGAFITTIGAPPAMAACSGQPAGCNCLDPKNSKPKNPLCASNHCCGTGSQDPCNIGCCSTDNNGTQCHCASGVCPSVPNPAGSCCNGICTPTTGSRC
jgi:hypothetical protein